MSNMKTFIVLFVAFAVSEGAEKIKACIKTVDCKKGFTFDFIACKCVEACQIVECPNENTVLNQENCECECQLHENDCPDDRFIFDKENCYCACNWDENYCRGLLDEREYSTCSCIRHTCDPPGPCPDGEDWNGQICNCVPVPTVSTVAPCSNTECLNEDYFVDPVNCKCVCKWNEENCSGPLAELDVFGCQCRRYPCDPPGPCPDGEMLDSSICSCVPDPSVTTKKSKVKCMPVVTTTKIMNDE